LLHITFFYLLYSWPGPGTGADHIRKVIPGLYSALCLSPEGNTINSLNNGDLLTELFTWYLTFYVAITRYQQWFEDSVKTGSVSESSRLIVPACRWLFATGRALQLWE
jgi:hypothetical protein